MFFIAETLIDREIPHAHFACDVTICKGACCCIEGGRGAPLEDAEMNEIEASFPIIRKYLSPEHLEVIERDGLYEGAPGNRATVCVEQKACVFAYFQDGIAGCSFERGYLAGEIGWRKPISCHLFPIRVNRHGNDVLRYEAIDECRAGRARGESENTPLIEFLEEPLVRKYGRSWYDSFRSTCQDSRDRAMSR